MCLIELIMSIKVEIKAIGESKLQGPKHNSMIPKYRIILYDSNLPDYVGYKLSLLFTIKCRVLKSKNIVEMSLRYVLMILPIL